MELKHTDGILRETCPECGAMLPKTMDGVDAVVQCDVCKNVMYGAAGQELGDVMEEKDKK